MTPPQFRAARAILDMSQQDVATAAGVSVTTLRNFERGATNPTRAVLSVLRSTMEARGVMFIEPNGGGAGVRLLKP